MRTNKIMRWATVSAVLLVLFSVFGATPAMATGDRFYDFAPHFGGTFISPTNSATALGCTAGFSVFNQFGLPASVTAGHCAPDGVEYNSGEFYGQVQGQKLNGVRDMARLESLSGTIYEPKIHTNPGFPTVRTVQGKADPEEDDLVCVSGAITEAKCNLKVLPGKHSLCYMTHNGPFCTHGLTAAERPDVPVMRKGDSGGPVYTRTGNNGAIINGMMIGFEGRLTSGGELVGNRVYFHTVSEIESGLDVTVMTR